MITQSRNKKRGVNREGNKRAILRVHSGDVRKASLLHRARNLIAAEAAQFLNTLATWVLMLALVLAVIVAVLALAGSLDKMHY